MRGFFFAVSSEQLKGQYKPLIFINREQDRGHYKYLCNGRVCCRSGAMHHNFTQFIKILRQIKSIDLQLSIFDESTTAGVNKPL